ncbi:MAG TPA: tetratricopeptide repeat protein [Kofleriaceae bacterium]|nr:tetratricopeptide repeat protein [Kofleriaceae bacterium]
MTRATLGWIATILVATGSVARADEPPDPRPAAKPFIDAGVAAYEAGDYETAIRELEAAHRIDPQPAILYAWAQALRLSGRCAEAIAVYQRYLATDPNAAQTTAAQHGISLCERTRPAEPAPDTAPPATPPATPPAAARSEPAPDPAIAPSQRRRWYADPLGGALVIGGAASLGVGVGLLVRSSQNRDAARDAMYREDFVELLDTATLQRRLGAASLGVGAALVAAGAVRYVTRRDRPGAVAVGVAGRALVILGRF